MLLQKAILGHCFLTEAWKLENLKREKQNIKFKVGIVVQQIKLLPEIAGAQRKPQLLYFWSYNNIPGKAAKDGLSTWAPATHVRDMVSPQGPGFSPAQP